MYWICQKEARVCNFVYIFCLYGIRQKEARVCNFSTLSSCREKWRIDKLQKSNQIRLELKKAKGSGMVKIRDNWQDLGPILDIMLFKFSFNWFSSVIRLPLIKTINDSPLKAFALMMQFIRFYFLSHYMSWLFYWSVYSVTFLHQMQYLLESH